jgi:hypothetical protein
VPWREDGERGHDGGMVVRVARLLALIGVLTGSFGELSQGLCCTPTPASHSHACCRSSTDQLQAACCHARQGERVVSSVVPVRVASDESVQSRVPALDADAFVAHASAARPAFTPPLIVLRI